MPIIITPQKTISKNDKKFNVDNATSACIDLLEKAKTQLLQYNETIKQYNECVSQVLAELEKNNQTEQLEQTNQILNPYIKPLNVERILEPLPDNTELISYKDLDDTPPNVEQPLDTEDYENFEGNEYYEGNEDDYVEYDAEVGSSSRVDKGTGNNRYKPQYTSKRVRQVENRSIKK